MKVVANVAVGYNNIDVAAARRRGVVVTNTPDVLTETTADFAWTLLMAAARRGRGRPLLRARASGRNGSGTLLWGADIHGKTLGVVGFGRIGRAVARRALGFNMRVLYQDALRADAAAERELRATRMDLELPSSRRPTSVSLHTPLFARNAPPHERARLRLMKKSAVLVNAARGPVGTRPRSCAPSRRGGSPARGSTCSKRSRTVHPGLVPLKNVVLAPHHRERIVRYAPGDGKPRRPQLPGRLDGKPPLTPVP